jgi:hypothetical protein
MRFAPLAAALAVLAGCGPGAPEQEAAERAVAREAGTADVDCTGRSRLWFAEGPPAEVFVCAARVGSGLCDRYRVERDGGEYRLRVIERRGSCTLPSG